VTFTDGESADYDLILIGHLVSARLPPFIDRQHLELASRPPTAPQFVT